MNRTIGIRKRGLQYFWCLRAFANFTTVLDATKFQIWILWENIVLLNCTWWWILKVFITIYWILKSQYQFSGEWIKFMCMFQDIFGFYLFFTRKYIKWMEFFACHKFVLFFFHNVKWCSISKWANSAETWFFFSFIMYHVHILIRHRKSFCSISIIWWYKLLCLSLGSFRLISFARLSSFTFHSFVNVFNTTFFSFCVCWNTGSTTKCSICV